MSGYKILVTEDEQNVRTTLAQLLNEAGYETVEAINGEDALRKLSSNIDLVILDVMMPGMSGYAVCSIIRRTSNVPILFLTARTDEDDLIQGLSIGGDDYLKKPFSEKELLARVDSIIRRSQNYNVHRQTSFIVCGDLKLRLDRNEVLLNSCQVSLTATEYGILKFLMEHAGEVLSPREIYCHVWGEPVLRTSVNTVMVHIRSLCKKIEKDPQHPRLICTVWGKGYSLATARSQHAET